MRPSIDVFVLGHETNIPPDLADVDWPASLKIIPTGARTLTDFVKSPAAPQLVDGDGELAALIVAADRELLRGVAIQAICLQGSACFVAIEQVDPDLPSTIDPTHFVSATHGTRILLAPRAEHGPIVFRRSQLRQVGPLRPVAEPVWDWLIRAARAGERVDSWPMPAGHRSAECRLPLLAPKAPGSEGDWLREHLAGFSLGDFGSRATASIDEIALRAGFYQWHDFLGESHELSQSIEGKGENQLGDYWHAIMHRREPDYSNAKYWFRRIGNQPIWRDLSIDADGILARCSAPEAPRWRDRLRAGSKWDPFAFVDLCEECATDETTDLALAARRIQYVEMCMLVARC